MLASDISDEEARSNVADVREDLEKYLSTGSNPVIKVETANYFLKGNGTAEAVFDLSPALATELKRVKSEYDKGGDWTGILFGVYNGAAALFAFLLPVLAKRINRRKTHLVSLVAGGLGLISMYIFPTPELLIISMIGVGLAWASILSMPYAMLTGSLPGNKMGVFMGIFNFFIVIPQITAATVLGALVGLFGGKSIIAILIGGVVMIFSGIITLKVKDDD